MAYESYQSLSENNCFIDSTMNDACPKNSYRLVVLGAPKVGKSSILNWFLGKSVDHNYVPTIEDFHKKVFKIRGEVYRLDILDTSGNDPFPAMKKLNVMTGDMFILVFSLDNVDSYTQVKHLLQLIVELKKPTAKQDSGRHSSGNTSTVPILVVGNKLDLLMDNKVVQRCAELGDIQQMVASTCGPKIAIYSEISALNSMGIETAFERLFTLAALPHEMLPNRHRTVEVNSSVSAVAASNPQNVSNPTVDSNGKVVKTESTSNIDAEIGAGGGLINKRLSAKFASARSSSLKLRKSVHANNNNANNITADSASTATTASTNNKGTESNGTTTTATPTPTTLKLSQAARKSFRKVTFRRAAAAESWGAVWLHARRPSIRAELKLLQLKKNPTTFKYHDYESAIGSSTAGSSSTSSSPTSKSPTSKSANSSFSEHTTKSLIPNGNSAVSRTKFRVLVDNFKNLVCSSDRSMKSSSKLL